MRTAYSVIRYGGRKCMRELNHSLVLNINKATNIGEGRKLRPSAEVHRMKSREYK